MNTLSTTAQVWPFTLNSKLLLPLCIFIYLFGKSNDKNEIMGLHPSEGLAPMTGPIFIGPHFKKVSEKVSIDQQQ